MLESKYLELKEIVNNSFAKTVSAFANYNTGNIVFGISDDGNIMGIKNPDKVCLDIENKINDLIKPRPDFSFEINRSTNLITLTVYEGSFKPYLYRGKAYKRTDTSTLEVDQIELRRLVMLGENLYFDMLVNNKRDVSFDYLFEALKTELVVDLPNLDSLKTLGLYSLEGYTNAGLLLADKNDFSGIDIARFGDNISSILFRERIFGVSILEQLDRAVEVFKTFYKYEEVSGMERVTKYLVPKEAFREAIANALVHRTWDVDSHIRVLMHPDRIEIFSPGGLPHGLSEEEYLNGFVSSFRNPIIANIFFRLKIIEMIGTGIRRIKESYANIKHKPLFDIKDNSILIVLPTTDMKDTMYPDEKTIYSSLSSGIYLASSDLVRETGFSKDKTIRLVNSLIKKNYVVKEGTGRGTKYRIR